MYHPEDILLSHYIIQVILWELKKSSFQKTLPGKIQLLDYLMIKHRLQDKFSNSAEQII